MHSSYVLGAAAQPKMSNDCTVLCQIVYITSTASFHDNLGDLVPECQIIILLLQEMMVIEVVTTCRPV